MPEGGDVEVGDGRSPGKRIARGGPQLFAVRPEVQQIVQGVHAEVACQSGNEAQQRHPQGGDAAAGQERAKHRLPQGQEGGSTSGQVEEQQGSSHESTVSSSGAPSKWLGTRDRLI
jgi:hypothetical protein